MGKMDDVNKTLIMEDPDEIEELSVFLSNLSNDVNLKILKLLEEEPMYIREISKKLNERWGISLNDANLRKTYLAPMTDAGIIRSEWAFVTTVSWGKKTMGKNYVLVPGSLEAVVRTLGMFLNYEFELKNKTEEVIKKIHDGFPEEEWHPTIRILGGEIDGKVFLIEKDAVKIGREPREMSDVDVENEIILPKSYKFVSRLSRPHAKLTYKKDRYYIEDCGSINGTYLLKHGERRLVKMAELDDGDLIRLGKGAGSTYLLFERS